MMVFSFWLRRPITGKTVQQLVALAARHGEVFGAKRNA